MLEVLETRGHLQQRFTEPVKFLPVAFVWCNIIGLYLIYMSFHCLPQLRDPGTYHSAVVQIAIFHVVTVFLVICYIQCILIHPGTVPDKDEDPYWEYVPQDTTVSKDASLNWQELKRSGDRRHCKWCGKYKPDRCHHCRVCRMCILKMDHHCPWIYNCVGFKNHKHFFLLLLYSTIDCHLIIWTMATSVRLSTDPRTPFMTMFLLLFGESLAGFLGLLVTNFFVFHIYLMFTAMTTIEFCEKSLKKTTYNASAYDRSLCGNLQAVLGDNVLLWLLPVSPPEGDGLTFVTEDMKLTKDMEKGREVRRRMHQNYGNLENSGPTDHSSTSFAPGSGASEEDNDESILVSDLDISQEYQLPPDKSA